MKAIYRTFGILALTCNLGVYYSSWNFHVASIPIILWLIFLIAASLEITLYTKHEGKRLIRAVFFVILIVSFLVFASKSSDFFSNQFFRLRQTYMENDQYLIETNRQFFKRSKDSTKMYFLSEFAFNGILIRETDLTYAAQNPTSCKVVFPESRVTFDACTRKWIR